MSKEVTIKKVISYFKQKGLQVFNKAEDENLLISSPKSIQKANKEHISLLTKKYKDECLELVSNSNSLLILIDNELFSSFQSKLPTNKVFVVCENPKSELITFCKELLEYGEKIKGKNIDPSASIDKNVVIGKNIFIGSNVSIEGDVIIGEGCIIGSNTVLKSGTEIGNEVQIGSCVVIGGDGFGYSQDSMNAEYEQFPHYGGVIIKDRVHIGSNTCIDRGSLDDTVIEQGVKIDNLVHIAHNVKIGKNSLIIAKSMIAGSVEIGDNCWIAPSCNILNGLKIGNNVFVGLASTVTRNLVDNEKVMGSPAVSLEEFKRLRKLQKDQLK